MPNLASVLKQEIARLARREAKSLSDQLKKSSAQYRRDIAELKRQVNSLQKQVAFLETQERERIVEQPAKLMESDKPVRFSAKWLAGHRKKLKLSAEEYGKLVGVTGQSIYAWEQERSRPRARQVAALAAVRSIGRREAVAKLKLLEA